MCYGGITLSLRGFFEGNIRVSSSDTIRICTERTRSQTRMIEITTNQSWEISAGHHGKLLGGVYPQEAKLLWLGNISERYFRTFSICILFYSTGLSVLSFAIKHFMEQKDPRIFTSLYLSW